MGDEVLDTDVIEGELIREGDELTDKDGEVDELSE